MSSWSVRRAASPPWWARTGQQLDGVLPPTAGTEARWETSYKNEEVGQIIGWSLEKYGLVVSCCQHQKQVQNTFLLDWFRAKDGQEYEISMTNGTWQPKRKRMLYNALLQCWRWYNFHLAPCCAGEKNHWQRKCLFWLFCLSNITTFLQNETFLWLRFRFPNWRLHVVGDLPLLGALAASLLQATSSTWPMPWIWTHATIFWPAHII